MILFVPLIVYIMVKIMIFGYLFFLDRIMDLMIFGLKSIYRFIQNLRLKRFKNGDLD